MPSYHTRVFYRWIDPKTNQVAGASNCSMHTISKSESGVIAELKRRNPNLARYIVVIDSLEWL